MSSVVTGIGVVAPNGVGAAPYWEATLAGRTGIGALTRFDGGPYGLYCAGEADAFDAARWVPSRLRAQTDRWTQLALAATEMALDDACVDPADVDEYDMAVYSASTAGGSEYGQGQLGALWMDGPAEVSAYMSVAWFYAATTGQLSIRHGMRGPCGVVVADQAGGLDALGLARRAVDDGVGLALTGGTEAPFCPYGVACLMAAGRTTSAREASTAYRPFDPAADGSVPGEGGAFMIVESERSAARRGVRPYATVAGHAATFDPPPGPDRLPVRSGLRRAIELAMADAGVSEVDLVFADAAGVPRLDDLEAAAITDALGAGVPVTAPKSMTGRLYAGGAALDVATAAMAVRDQMVPPTVGLAGTVTDPRIDLVDSARRARLDTVLVLARGEGGFNSALVLTR